MSVQFSHASDRDPWERQERETSRMYAYFCLYRDAGPHRPLLPEGGRGRARKSLSFITKLAIKKQWTSRVDAWDIQEEARKRQIQRQAIDEMNDRQARIAMTVFTVVARRLVGDPTPGQEVSAIDPNTLNARDISALAGIAQKLERTARLGDEKDEVGDAVKLKIAFEISPVFPGAIAAQQIEAPLVEPGQIVEGDYEEVDGE